MSFETQTLIIRENLQRKINIRSSRFDLLKLQYPTLQMLSDSTHMKFMESSNVQGSKVE
jgi:hypothetical protein